MAKEISFGYEILEGTDTPRVVLETLRNTVTRLAEHNHDGHNSRGVAIQNTHQFNRGFNSDAFEDADGDDTTNTKKWYTLADDDGLYTIAFLDADLYPGTTPEKYAFSFATKIVTAEEKVIIYPVLLEYEYRDSILYIKSNTKYDYLNIYYT